MSSKIIGVTIFLNFILVVSTFPLSDISPLQRERRQATNKATLNTTVEKSKGAGDQVNITHPKQLINLGTHGNVTNKHNHTLPDGRTVMRMEMTVYGYPVLDADVTFVEDLTEDNQYEVLKNKYTTEIHRMADILLRKPTPWKIHSYALCGQAWNISDDVDLNTTLSTRYLFYNETTNTLAFADKVIIQHNKRMLFDKRCLIDASNGTVIGRHNGIKSASYPAGNSRIGKQQVDINLPVDATTAGNCLLQSPDGKIQVFNGKNGVPKDSSLPVMSFNCQTGPGDETNGGFGPAVDVYNNIVLTRQCLLQKIPGAIDVVQVGAPGNIIKAYVHDNSDENKDNAAFVPGVGGFFSDGGDTSYPQTTIKSVSHELGHGIVGKFSDLDYEKESGCMNEAFADMTGFMVGFCATGTNDWTQDNDSEKNDPAEVRNIALPTTDGQQIKQWSDYTGDNTEVHHCSGLYNYVFYQLTTAPGWDIYKAYTVFYAANTIWSKTSTMSAGACDVIRMARQLKYSSDDVNTIVGAFTKVGIQLPSDCNVLPYTGTPLQDQTIAPDSNVQQIDNCATYDFAASATPTLSISKLTIDASMKATALQVLIRPAGTTDASAVSLFVTKDRMPAFLGDSDFNDGAAIVGSVITATAKCPVAGDYYIGINSAVALSYKVCATATSNSC